MNIALCITHADFDDRRRAAMARLRKELQLGDIVLDEDDGKAGHVTVPGFGRISYREQTGKMPCHVWSEEQWRWGASMASDTWVLYLQDDVIVAPDFWNRIEQLELNSGVTLAHWVSLLTNHWGSRGVFLAGCSGYGTADGVMGVGYAATAEEIREFLAWRSTAIVPGMVEKISEDVLISLYCLAKTRTVYTPLPGLIDHDLEVGTLHAKEHFGNRRAYVRWDDEDRLVNAPAERTMYLGRYYETAHTMLPGVLLDAIEGVRLARHHEPDRCPPKFGQYFEMIVAKEEWP